MQYSDDPLIDAPAPSLHFMNTPTANQPKWNTLFVQSQMPKKLEALHKISRNIWWCWHHDALTLFANIDAALWESTEHNPVAMLEQLSFEQLTALEKDKAFLTKLNAVEQNFDAYMAKKPIADSPRVAYFCMEYGFHTSVKLYSGGLGILAGDYLKEASDCATDMVAVGLLYRYGYFKQELSLHGDQINVMEHQRFTQMPYQPVRDAEGNWLRIGISLPGRTLHAKVWVLNVGRVPLYLLDTDITENSPEDRGITSALYGGDWELRIKQEMLLGLGGAKVLKQLGIQRDVCHYNEGHAAFTGLERLKDLVLDKKLSIDEAIEVVRASSLFTTHTPVPAGHDAFDEGLLRTYMGGFAYQLGMEWHDFVGLGRLNAHDSNEKFSMSILACRLSQEVNGVSKIHGIVSQKMLKPIWDGFTAEELHITSVTNGVHYPTWVAHEWHELFEKAFGKDFVHDQANTKHWEKIHKVADADIWNLRQKMKKRLVSFAKTKIREDMTKRHVSPRLVFDTINAINENALVIGFARRFATYKRAYLLFHDLEKLHRILNTAGRPLIFLFAGKAHPADKQGQELIKKITEVASRPEFVGKIIFLENYNMNLATYLVQGVDVWLNTPTRPLEASGTSGMKTNYNGGLNFSVLDGWWAEGHKEGAGWALPEEQTYENHDFQNELDAQLIYDTLEHEILPAYFNRDENGIPTEWVHRVKRTIAEIAPEFTMKRMLDEYFEKFYHKLAKRHRAMESNNFQLALDQSAWKRRVLAAWDGINVTNKQVYDTSNRAVPLGDNFEATISLNLNGLGKEDIGLEWVFGKRKLDGYFNIMHKREMELMGVENGVATYRCSVQMSLAGVYEYGFRFFPKNENLPHRQDFALVQWI
jgi:alpha-glucan phosphorylase-like protein